ncbi:MAG: hypothetical protein IT348_16435 [Candidatus Eisenbacteria bacterium]|nr:hypothetical protein [Candidatus Eisenbacteria bacterium]
MPRGRKLEPLYGPVQEWRAARDARGQWVVATCHGERVLQHPDPMVRMQAVHLAAQAPLLRHLLELVTKRLHVTLESHCSYYSRDARLVSEVWIAIADTRPRFEEVLRMKKGDGQLELPLDAEEGVA